MSTLNDATMIVACKEGDAKTLADLLEQDPECFKRSIEWTDQDQKDLNTPPIFIAVDYGHLELVKLFSEKGDVNIVDSNAYTPLSWASWNGNKELVNCLIASGAKVDQDALDLAREYEHKEIVDILSEHIDLYAALGGDIDEMMIKASREGDVKKVQELIAEGYDFNKWKEEDGSYREYSPIYVAMKNGHVELIREFMAAGVEAELHSTHFYYPEDEAAKTKPAELSDEQIAEIVKAMKEEEAAEADLTVINEETTETS
jgi:Ankyrin repeats (3 copies)